MPIAALGSWVLRIPFAQINGLALVLGIFVFWVACVSISAVIAAIFVLTPHAMTYEGLLLVPLILVSEILTSSKNMVPGDCASVVEGVERVRAVPAV